MPRFTWVYFWVQGHPSCAALTLDHWLCKLEGDTGEAVKPTGICSDMAKEDHV